ncbi:efflux RND transporter periplasmic adaptor subunit [Blastopirellula sp. JC732]|uniref:Efflux RND transporter periplasmic adaptor subunit n=1 Tax=Blastopirellula sediminis TaxID=2894196 RepID=A0A9X1MN79_9BACT|nr:efflux RND transporter periplasmic adaptor subunit [Blastopirellula sediminis]MCC9606384.1 efflux RND transporter periplasmic adaptor subunit [Blastopirellula sediminis]MCC9630318.1 efflux RND transporter periplasmic adaptor subunit [Blastopirellula sediminis]
MTGFNTVHLLGVSANGRRGSTTRLVVASLAVVSVIVGAAFYWNRPSAKGVVASNELFHTIERGAFLHDVVERGQVESASNVEVKSEVRSYRTTNSFEILWAIDEGAPVKKGDLLIRLDSSALEEEQTLQQMDVTQSIASLSKAENELAAAQIAMNEYVLGTFMEELNEIESEITLAEENVRRAEEYLLYSGRLAAKGYVTSLQLQGDQFALKKAKIELEKSQTKKKVLQEYTKEKKIKELDSNIKVAEADLEAAKERLELENKMLQFFEDQIAACEIRAPQNGQVVYANVSSGRDSSDFVLEPGAKVRERQTLVRLPDYEAMQIVCDVNESRIALIEKGMPATIKLDAYDNLELMGEVIRVNEYPTPGNWMSSSVKKYAVTVKVLNPTMQIKPGMTSQVSIHVESSADVVQAPVQAVYEHDGSHFCILRDASGMVQARRVEIGSNNSRFVVISKGLQPGDQVAMNPRGFLDSVDLPAAVSPAEKIAQRFEEVNAREKSTATTSVTSSAAADVEKIANKYDRDGDGALNAAEIGAEATTDNAAPKESKKKPTQDQVADAETSAAATQEHAAQPERQRPAGGGQ